MIKRTAAALALVLIAAACASTPMTSSTAAGGPTTASLGNVRNSPDYILLSAPEQIRSWDFSSNYVRGLHVRGTMTNRGFIPAAEILGNGKFCTDGQDWLSLGELKVYKVADGKTPAAPYILGCATTSGFQPASRAIVTQ
jgi:hypothetical protein